MRTLTFLSLALLLGACSDDRGRSPGTRSNNGTPDSGSVQNTDGGVSQGDHTALCSTSCIRTQSGPCAAGVAGQCQSDCAALTNGLNSTCASCMLDRSGWRGLACTCYGDGCTLCPFGPGPSGCGGAGPDDTCEAQEEICRGFEFDDPTGACQSLCFPPNDPPDLGANLRGRCEYLCRGDRKRACDGAPEATCVSACMARVENLGSGCAVCVLESSGWSGRACTCDGAGCNLCPFGPGPSGCNSAAPEDTCGASEEVCDGMQFGAVDSSDCLALCQR